MLRPAASTFGPRATWQTLRLRAALLKQLRAFFDSRGFLEVETPIVSADVVVDRHLDPLSTTLAHNPPAPGDAPTLWLQTSPEFHMKRLLAAGSGPIYQITRAFRGGEQGRLHNPEFTMIEWYQPQAGYRHGMTLLSDLARDLLGRGAAEVMTYRNAFLGYLRLDPHRATANELRSAAQAAGVPIPETLADDDRDAWLELLLVERVQPWLGIDRPLILCDYPASQSALATTRCEANGVEVAERFELYVSGVELANGYHELRDPDELRRRNAINNDLRARDGKPPLPVESLLLPAMESGLPPAVGVALGFDRLVMLAAGLSSVADAMAFPIDRA
jgi:lysyl-tRNA synthetase class 2